MRTTRKILGILALSLALGGIAQASPALDAQGKCRDHGKFVDAKQCAAKAPAVHCRDITTKKFAKCSAPNTEPVPKAAN
jgi:hypothetical protein